MNYHAHAERLARAGLRVVVVEQCETPTQLAERNEERKKQRLPKVRLSTLQRPRCSPGTHCPFLLVFLPVPQCTNARNLTSSRAHGPDKFPGCEHTLPPDGNELPATEVMKNNSGIASCTLCRALQDTATGHRAQQA